MTDPSQNSPLELPAPQELSTEFPPDNDNDNADNVNDNADNVNANDNIPNGNADGENGDDDDDGDNSSSNELNESMNVDDWLDEAVSAVTSMDNVDVAVPGPSKSISKQLDDNYVPVPDEVYEEANNVNVSALEMMMQSPTSTGARKRTGTDGKQNVGENETDNDEKEEKKDDDYNANSQQNENGVVEVEAGGDSAETDGQTSASKSLADSFLAGEKTALSAQENENNIEHIVEASDTPLEESQDAASASAADRTKSPPQDQQEQQQHSQPPPPPQDQKSTLRNRFSSWRSKADAAIQNNQMLKMAQKNIEETRKEVQKVVENNILNNGIISNLNENEHDENSLGSNDNDLNDDVEDDLSYENKSGDEESQGSSVYVNSDASYSSYSDDASSVRASSIARRRTSRSSSPTTSSTNSRSPSSSPRRWAPTPQTLFRGDLNDPDGTPLAKNTTVADVASGYKGRYEATRNANQRRENMLKQLQRKMRAPSPTPLATVRHAPKKVEKYESQTSLLHMSIPAPKIEKLLKSLPLGQYLMFLRPGMLGVNLKQTYLSGHGVYVDMIFPGGNATKSGVICIGDGLVKVGDTDVSKGKIHDVPGIIAKSKRPAILVLNGEHGMKWEEMDYLAVAIGVVNRILDESKKGQDRTFLDKIEAGSQPLSVVPQAPPRALREEIARYASKRNNQTPSFSLISAACQQDENLRQILRQAFRICCIDNRRLPFFAAFLSDEDAFNMNTEKFGDAPVTISASTRLMLYLELLSYKDLFSETPPKKRLDHAKLISSKFLLPRGSTDPQFDLRSMFPNDVLNALQESANAVSEETIDLDYFKDVESCLEDSLASAKFASFLLSDACARMRAYLRGVAPYIDPHLASVVRQSSFISSKEHSAARNHLKFTLVYLLFQLENDALDKNFEKKDRTMDKEPTRLQCSAAGLSCAIFISRVLAPSIEAAQKHVTEGSSDPESSNIFGNLISAVEMFWETFVAPHGGLLESSSHSDETNDLIEIVRQAMLKALNKAEEAKDDPRLLQLVQCVIQNGDFTESLPKLRDELIYDYYVSRHPKYRAHMIHEWMCEEANSALHDKSSQETKEQIERADKPPRLLEGAISRLIRKLEIPRGISRHCPVHKPQNQIVKEKQAESAKCNFNADFALVFAKCQFENKNNENEPTEHLVSSDISNLQHVVCIPLSDNAKYQIEKKAIEEILPSTIMSYATIPPLKARPFGDPIHYGRTTQNGWEVTLINFMAPNANNSEDKESDSFLYGVSLVMNCVSEGSGFKSVENVVTLTLVSERNVIPAMRSSLVKMYEEKVISKPHNRDCTTFVQSLERLHLEEDKSQILSTMLEPFIKIGSSKWLEQPLVNQEKAFERSCLEVLVESLSPIPLSLLFITTLLEQKIVFTSSRRSVLVSMIAGLRSLLRPLGWSHLIVPIVPSSLANDLVHYPAPFILGIPLDDKGSMDFLKRIPENITLVDVDAGRVILTKQFSHHFESKTNDDEKASATALRSQVLHLAENLGNVIGAYQSDSVWRCDSPLHDSFVEVDPAKKVEAIQKIAHAFIRELTAGVNSCCYWIEEESDVTKSQVEQNILFDEDRFFHLKQLRSQGLYSSFFKGGDLAISRHCSLLEPRPILALNMTDFNLVMETFIRGQAISSYVSSQDKNSMPFW